MDTVKASVMWHNDRFNLWNEDVAVCAFVPEPFAEDHAPAHLLLELDDTEREPGRIAGLEIFDFLDFDRWDELPQLLLLWQLPGWEPLPLDELLKRKQHELRQQTLQQAQ